MAKLIMHRAWSYRPQPGVWAASVLLVYGDEDRRGGTDSGDGGMPNSPRCDGTGECVAEAIANSKRDRRHRTADKRACQRNWANTPRGQGKKARYGHEIAKHVKLAHNTSNSRRNSKRNHSHTHQHHYGHHCDYDPVGRCQSCPCSSACNHNNSTLTTNRHSALARQLVR
jgi:hypothetical protein